eukprot:1160969-Pelagomonas_calceolata.AAC.2
MTTHLPRTKTTPRPHLSRTKATPARGMTTDLPRTKTTHQDHTCEVHDGQGQGWGVAASDVQLLQAAQAL